jgi:hypothetical protein
MVTREEFLGRFFVLDYPGKFDAHMLFSFIDWAGNDVRLESKWTILNMELIETS